MSKEQTLEKLQPGLAKDAERIKIHGDIDPKAKHDEVVHMHEHNPHMGKKDVNRRHTKESPEDSCSQGVYNKSKEQCSNLIL